MREQNKRTRLFHLTICLKKPQPNKNKPNQKNPKKPNPNKKQEKKPKENTFKAEFWGIVPNYIRQLDARNLMFLPQNVTIIVTGKQKEQ